MRVEAFGPDHHLVHRVDQSMAQLIQLREMNAMYARDVVQKRRDDLDLNGAKYAQEALGRYVIGTKCNNKLLST